MEKNIPIVALIYDFDKTLSPKDMQAFGYIEKSGIKEEDFWKMSDEFSFINEADRILGYMYLMIKTYKDKGLPLTKDFLRDCGKDIQLFKGVETWFERINKFGKDMGVNIEHYVVSSGLKEMIEGTKIAKYFKKIYAGSFIYDANNNPIWPAMSINYTNKTQYIYRINKGILNVIDDNVNESMPHDERRVPFTNMIYIGDSVTDIPCMRLVMKSGGNAVGVYQENTPRTKDYLKKLIMDNRINYVVKADYSENSDLDQIVKEIVTSIKHADNLKQFTKKQKQNL